MSTMNRNRQRVVEALRACALIHTQLRMGQIIDNAVTKYSSFTDLFYLDDVVLAEALEQYAVMFGEINRHE